MLKHKTKPAFTLIELLVVIAIISILTTIGISSFRTARIKARDAQRKNDLNQIAKALELYYNDHGQYPASDSDGQILGCNDGTSVCSWGRPFKTTNTTYMATLPADPSYPTQTYFYQTQTVYGKVTAYILYARLENIHDSQTTTYNSTNCGSNLTCNYAISSANISP